MKKIIILSLLFVIILYFCRPIDTIIVFFNHSMMKKLSSIFFVKYLLIGICSLSFVNLNAQTCDENVLKALEQTRATTFENVNVGGEGYFYIRYPFPGTT